MKRLEEQISSRSSMSHGDQPSSCEAQMLFPLWELELYDKFILKGED